MKGRRETRGGLGGQKDIQKKHIVPGVNYPEAHRAELSLKIYFSRLMWL